MKYIIADDGWEEVILFDGIINHSDMFKMIKRHSTKLVSAGKIQYDDCITDDFKFWVCSGSQTLGISLASRCEKDYEIIKRFMERDR